MRSLDYNAERGPASPAQSKEQVFVLTLVRCAVDAVRGDNLDLDLREQKSTSCAQDNRRADLLRDPLRDHIRVTSYYDHHPARHAHETLVYSRKTR